MKPSSKSAASKPTSAHRERCLPFHHQVIRYPITVELVSYPRHAYGLPGDENTPERFQFIADGYSAYPLAAMEFAKFDKNFTFQITQVLGLTNDDAVSKNTVRSNRSWNG